MEAENTSPEENSSPQGYSSFGNESSGNSEVTANETNTENSNSNSNENANMIPNINMNELENATSMNNTGASVNTSASSEVVTPETFPQSLNAEQARQLAGHLIHSYFTTQLNPLVRHHIESQDQFLQRDLQAIITAANPITILKNPKSRRGAEDYMYKVEIQIGGESGDAITIGTPTVSLQQGKDIRVLQPNEARLRNLTQAVQVEADVFVRVTMKVDASPENPKGEMTYPIEIKKLQLFNLPLMLHSRYCLLHGKPASLLTEMGECPQDQGGYFIVDGAEKVLITRQEGAFNTLWITEQKADPNVQYYANISSLNPKSREVKRVSFYWTRETTRMSQGFQKIPVQRPSILEVGIPYCLKPLPIFVLFRALGVQSDKEILQLIFPDLESPEAKLLADLLIPSMNAAAPFLDTYSAIQQIKTLTKGFSEFHVLDIVHNHLFPHVEDLPGARVTYLAECVRKILRVVKKLDTPPSRDDTRQQRCLTSGFLVQMLFQNLQKNFVKTVKLKVDETYSYNESVYSGMDFLKIFGDANRRIIFAQGYLTEGLLRGFKGKWSTGANKEETGVLQALSRLSYLDFMSHMRRVVLNFDTSMKLQGPRRLHTSQYGYFCTSETPSGSHIGVTKNLSMFTTVSTGAYPDAVIQWLFTKGRVVPCEQITPQLAATMVPVQVNSGIVGQTSDPRLLSRVLRLLKRGSFLPPLSSSGFSIPERRVFLQLDDGRPLRPLIVCEPHGHLPDPIMFKRKSWREFVVGLLRPEVSIGSREFVDPLSDKPNASLADQEHFFQENLTKLSVIEYLDPQEQNESLIANYPEHIVKETTHMEIHPSTILGLLGNMIPQPNHNQSPRNQLSASQSKQGLSLQATNWNNRFDNTANVLCQGQAPLCRTIQQNYVGDGMMSQGQNVILAMGMQGGQNQEDGIIMNADALARGQFRSLNQRSQEAFEEDDTMAHIQIRIGNPKQIPQWLDLNTKLDQSKLDDAGIVREGEQVDQNTVIVGRYQIGEKGRMKDASVTPQVWTRGRVEKVVILVNNAGLRLVKVRVVQDRVPELGDKFCLTPDHEVLTKRGWIGIADVTTEDHVAQLNREKGVMEQVQPKETFEFDHKGDMQEVKTQGVNLCTTLNHRMWVQTRQSSKYELIEAKDMMGKRVRFSSSAPTSAKAFCLDQYTEEDMKSFLVLLGLWIAEGWVEVVPEQHIHRLVQAANKPQVQEALKNVCEELSLKWSLNEKSKKFQINSKELATTFTPLSTGATKKRLPSWCFELSQEQSRLLLEALCMGDGHESATSLHQGTSSIGLRDDIQILTQHAGWTSTQTKLMEKGQVNIDRQGRQQKASEDHWGVQIRRKRLQPTLNHSHAKTQGGQTETIVSQDGKVQCLSVPSEVFLVRREGTIVWTGNSNRHGQKGTINVLQRATDMPRTAEGITPDMIMNPTAIPSRMTIGQILEMMFGVVAAELGAIANVTAFMNDGSPHETFGKILESLGLNKMCNTILQNGMTGEQMTADIYMGVVQGMRLKHMTEDKWNARGEGRREQRTHQPTGGRGNEGGMKMGEMERDAVLAHGVASFQNESYMLRSDGANFQVCNGCGTIPIQNERQNFYLCSLCDGPIQFSGDSAANLEPIPPPTRSAVSFSKISFPYASKVFFQELETFMNMGLRILTTKDTTRLRGLDSVEELVETTTMDIAQPLPKLVFAPESVPELPAMTPVPTAAEVAKQLASLNEESRSAQQRESVAPQNELISTTEPTQLPFQQEIQLAPGSFEPVIVAKAMTGDQAGMTEEGVPIIQVDTSDAAMSQAGLTQPRDATVALETVAPQALPQSQQQSQSQPQPQVRRAVRVRRPATQQPYQQTPGVMEGGNPMDDGEGQESKPNASMPIQVVKLGTSS